MNFFMGFMKMLLVFLFALWCNIGTLVECGTIGQHAKAIARRIIQSRSLPFEDCGSRYLILYLSISSCNRIPCIMHRGTKVQVNVLFDDDGHNTNFLKHRVRWMFNNIKTDAQITPDPCDGFHECLTNNSDGKTYWASLNVNDTLPVISGTMLWESVNEYNKNVLCFKVPVTIAL